MTNETASTSTTTTDEPEAKIKRSHGFIPKFHHKKVTIRFVSGGQPITGTVEGYDAYEIKIQTSRGPIIVFKHAIATIEPIEEPKQGFIQTE